MFGSFLEKVNVGRIVANHWDTLRASPTAKHRKPLDFLLMYGVPLGVGIYLWGAGVQAQQLDGFLEGASLLAGLLLTLLFTSVDLLDRDPAPGDLTSRRRRRMTKAAYHNVAYAFIVSLFTIALLAAVHAVTPADRPVSPAATGALGGLGLHLGLTMLMAVNRLYTVLDQTEISSSDSDPQSSEEQAA